jgi:hypothetical protein
MALAAGNFARLFSGGLSERGLSKEGDLLKKYYFAWRGRSNSTAKAIKNNLSKKNGGE